MNGPTNFLDATASIRGEQIERLKAEVATLNDIVAAAYRALNDGRRGDALRLLRPKTVTAPIAATGDRA